MAENQFDIINVNEAPPKPSAVNPLTDKQRADYEEKVKQVMDTDNAGRITITPENAEAGTTTRGIKMRLSQAGGRIGAKVTSWVGPEGNVVYFTAVNTGEIKTRKPRTKKADKS